MKKLLSISQVAKAAWLIFWNDIFEMMGWPNQLRKSIASLFKGGVAVVGVMSICVVGNAFAACSGYKGLATINEVHRNGNSTRFVEIKLLDSSIAPAVWGGWKIRLCGVGNICSGNISMSSAIDNSPWLVIDKPDISNRNFIDLQNGTDVILTDASGNTIDYLSVAGYTNQKDTSCTPAYDWEMSSSVFSDKTIERSPDGTGDWRTSGAGSSGGNTTTGTNDEAPGGGPAPTVSVTNIIVVKGQTATFTLSLASSVGYDITVSYQTQNGTAVAGTDYTAASGTATILSGLTSTTIDVTTNAVSASGEVSFKLYLYDPVNGTMSNHFPIATILGKPLAYWQMDEPSWTGAAGQVTDLSGNGYNGTAINGAGTADSISALAGNPGTCGYGVFDGNNDYVALPGMPSLTGSFTISAWIRPDRIDKDQRIFVDDENNSGGFAFSLGDNANGQLRFFTRGSPTFILDTPTTITAGTWWFVAVVHNAATKSISIYATTTGGTPTLLRQGNYSGTWTSDSGTASIGGETNSAGSENNPNWRFDGLIDEVSVYSSALSGAALNVIKQQRHACPTAGVDHFVISHDGFGISCLAEPITVTAKLADGSTYAGYTGSIVLDAQSTGGNWSLNSGTALNFSDATADDGVAAYTFSAADNGVAIFDLDYQGGTPTINIDAYEGAIRDDDTEGDLSFSPYGFTVTASPLAVPFLGVVNTVIPAQTSANDFQLHLALFGQTPTDPTCGIIEDYTGAKNLKFWSSYNDPVTGTVPVKVNTVDAFVNEAAANVGATQPVTFVDGQAVVTVSYVDVGQISLGVKDGAVTPVLPTDFRGVSNTFVVKPAGFVLSAIRRTSDSVVNPGTALDENGAAFIAAGADFTVTVTAVNALGDATPNYGQETSAESVLLTPVLVAAGAANNPAIGFATGFDGFVSGVDTGTDFHWDEVGIITLTPSVGDGDYLGAGDVTGTVSANVGRFYPDHFVTAKTDGSFANTCTTGTAFTYLGESFNYLGSPTATATAESAVSTITANYTGAWAKLDVAGVSLTYPVADNTQLDEGGLVAIGVTSTEGTLSRVDNTDGSLTFTLGGAAADSFSYVRDAGQVVPFTSDLTIQLTAVSDGEASASDLGTPKAINPSGNQQRFGRGYAQDVHGTMSQTGDSLTMSIGSWYFAAGGIWTLNADDSCSSYAYVKVDNDISTTIPVASASPLTLNSGVGSLTMSITADAGNPGGSSVVTTTWPSWLQYDVDGVDQLLDGNNYDDDPSATATFGIFRGEDRYLYWRESP